MSVYNMKSTDEAGKFIITKFDDDLNVESSYEFHSTTNGQVCHCPAGQRPSCRHRQMFNQLVDRVDSAWMLDFDTRAWVDPTGEAQEAEHNSEQAPDVVTEIALSKPEPMPEGQPLPEPILSFPDSHPFRRRM